MDITYLGICSGRILVRAKSQHDSPTEMELSGGGKFEGSMSIIKTESNGHGTALGW
jgi:hypothetical protein